MKSLLTISRTLIPFFIVIAILFLPSLIYAQAPDPGGDPDAAAAPIDGGLSILLAAGVGYGVKKINDQRKKKAAEREEDVTLK